MTVDTDIGLTDTSWDGTTTTSTGYVTRYTYCEYEEYEQSEDQEDFEWKKQEEKYVNKYFNNAIPNNPIYQRVEVRPKRFKQKMR